MTDTPKLYYTNENMKIDLRKMVDEIRADGLLPEYIVGIARGGLVAATYLSHALDVPLLTFHYSLRDHTRQDRFEHLGTLLRQGKRILFVDDICDEGHTLAKIWQLVRERSNDKDLEWTHAKSAVLINNVGQDVFTPDYAGTVINKAQDPVWVVFPWEEI